MRSLRAGLVVLAAPLLLSVQVKTSAQGDAASAGTSSRHIESASIPRSLLRDLPQRPPEDRRPEPGPG